MDANGSSVFAEQFISACALVLSLGVGLAASDMIRMLTERNNTLFENRCRSRNRLLLRHESSHWQRMFGMCK